MRKNILFLALFLFANLLYSQDLGISYVKMNTDNYEIQNPKGFGINLYKNFQKSVLFVQIQFVQNTRYFYGVIPGQEWNDCEFQKEMEKIRSKSALLAFDAGINSKSLIKIKNIQLNVGTGFSVNFFNTVKWYRFISCIHQNIRGSVLYGFFYLGSITIHNVLKMPVNLVFHYKYKLIPVYDKITVIEKPYSKPINMHIFEIGLVYFLRK